jgi:molecular chaperone GrpE
MDERTPNLEDCPETPAGGDDVVISDTVAQLEALAAERDILAAQKAELQDLLLRKAAEFDNYRKRSDREKAEIAEYGAADAVKAILPVLDDFERAQKVETTDSEYARGTALIFQRLSEALKKMGLEPMECLGKPFDPNFHHAIELVATEDAEDQTVFDELQKGYLFKGRLLRPAMVRVATRS